MITNITNDQMVPECTGMGVVSDSFNRVSAPFFSSTKIKPLASLGIDKDLLVYGDEATYYFARFLGLPYGTPSIEHDVLQSGWQWKWNLGNNTLVVKNSEGETVAIRQIECWADLKVSYEVLSSHQFIYFKGADAYKEEYFIVSRLLTNRASGTVTLSWGWLDKYLTAAFHAAYKRLVKHMTDSDMNGTDYVKPVNKYNAIIDLRSAITASIADLAASGYFDFKLWIIDSAVPADRLCKLRQTVLNSMGKIIMIEFLSACLISKSNPCYEPWMLWQVFKWFSHDETIIIVEKIFDLSPRWGE